MQFARLCKKFTDILSNLYIVAESSKVDTALAKELKVFESVSHSISIDTFSISCRQEASSKLTPQRHEFGELLDICGKKVEVEDNPAAWACQETGDHYTEKLQYIADTSVIVQIIVASVSPPKLLAQS